MRFSRLIFLVALLGITGAISVEKRLRSDSASRIWADEDCSTIQGSGYTRADAFQCSDQKAVECYCQNIITSFQTSHEAGDGKFLKKSFTKSHIGDSTSQKQTWKQEIAKIKAYYNSDKSKCPAASEFVGPNCHSVCVAFWDADVLRGAILAGIGGNTWAQDLTNGWTAMREKLKNHFSWLNNPAEHAFLADQGIANLCQFYVANEIQKILGPVEQSLATIDTAAVSFPDGSSSWDAITSEKKTDAITEAASTINEAEAKLAAAPFNPSKTFTVYLKAATHRIEDEHKVLHLAEARLQTIAAKLKSELKDLKHIVIKAQAYWVKGCTAFQISTDGSKLTACNVESDFKTLKDEGLAKEVTI